MKPLSITFLIFLLVLLLEGFINVQCILITLWFLLLMLTFLDMIPRLILKMCSGPTCFYHNVTHLRVTHASISFLYVNSLGDTVEHYTRHELVSVIEM